MNGQVSIPMPGEKKQKATPSLDDALLPSSHTERIHCGLIFQFLGFQLTLLCLPPIFHPVLIAIPSLSSPSEIPSSGQSLSGFYLFHIIFCVGGSSGSRQVFCQVVHIHSWIQRASCPSWNLSAKRRNEASLPPLAMWIGEEVGAGLRISYLVER